jgi:hypothetical protein
MVAVVLIAFYAGALADAVTTTDDALSIPETISVVPSPPPGSMRSTEATFTFAESQSDRLLTAAAVAAIVATLFLLARLAVIVVRRVRASH